MPRKRFPARPAKPFRISGLAVNLDIVARHTRAGFEDISHDHVRWHFLLFLRFLAEKDFLLDSDGVDAKTELWSSDLTSEGYRFCQYAEGKWIDRLYKGDDDIAGRRFLNKWYESFKALPKDAFDWTDDA